MEKDCYLTITHELETITKLSRKSTFEGLHIGPDNVAIATDGRICAFLGGYYFNIDFHATIPLTECVFGRHINLQCFECGFHYREDAFELLRQTLLPATGGPAAFNRKRIQSILRVVNKICAKDAMVSWRISAYNLLRIDTTTLYGSPLTLLLAYVASDGLPCFRPEYVQPYKHGNKRSITKMEV